MTVAEAVADWLAEKEIRHAFGIVGAGNLPLWQAIAQKGATQIVCCHHEQAAVMAASFYQRVSENIAVALVTTGAGSTNAITGVMAAFMDSTPVLVVSGNETEAALRGKTRVLGVQGYRSAQLADHFTVESFDMPSYTDEHRSEGVSALLGRAYFAALGTYPNKRPGPVWLNIARDIQNAPVR